VYLLQISTIIKIEWKWKWKWKSETNKLRPFLILYLNPFSGDFKVYHLILVYWSVKFYSLVNALYFVFSKIEILNKRVEYIVFFIILVNIYSFRLPTKTYNFTWPNQKNNWIYKINFKVHKSYLLVIGMCFRRLIYYRYEYLALRC
jgi:uncharacterized membrane protein